MRKWYQVQYMYHGEHYTRDWYARSKEEAVNDVLRYDWIDKNSPELGAVGVDLIPWNK